MADHLHHHHQHRPHRLSLPSRPTTTPITTSRPYPPFPSTPIPTPSKQRLLTTKPPIKTTSSTSLPFLLLLLFSLRSLYSLLPFLRSSPSSFSIFPFSFLVSLLSFLLSLSFSLFTSTSSSSSSSSSRLSFQHKQTQPLFSLSSITHSQHIHILSKSFILAIVFLLRFQALRYCGTSAMILAELSGNVAARFLDGKNPNRNFVHLDRIGPSKVRGFFALFIGLLLLSISWDRIECFPLSLVNVKKLGFFKFVPNVNCVRVWPMLLPFLSGFLGSYERVSMNWINIRELGRKKVRLVSLFYTTILLFIPAVISMFVFEAEGDSVSLSNLGWPLANTVVFGVLLSENYTDEKLVNSKDFSREFAVTFFCTLILELFYYPELSLWGLLICGLFLGVAVRELDAIYSNPLKLGLESYDSFTTLIMKPVHHILSERKSRKIALFLLINTGYMVVEFVAGFMSNSLGLISDACHMLFDCAALAIGLYASYISRLPANGEFNYGRGRFEVLSGYVNAVFLVLVGVLIVLESLERILEPQEISTSSLLTVSIGGLLVNVVGLIFFHDEHHHAHGGSAVCSHSHSHHHSHSNHDNHNSHDHVGNAHHDHDHDCDHHDHHNSHDHVGNAHHDYDHNCDHHDHRHHLDHEQHHHHHHDHEHHNHHHHDNHHDHDHRDNHRYEDHHAHGHQNDHHHHDADGHALESHTHGDPQTIDKKNLRSAGGSLEQHHHHHIDHNMEGIFLHVLADTLGSVGVVISTLLIRYKGWVVADPACSIFISLLIVSSVIPLLRNSAEILLQRVPRAHEQELKEAVGDIMKVKGVNGIQNLHVWSFTNTDVVGTLHLLVSKDGDMGSTKAQVSDILHDAGIKDLTLQVDYVQNS